MPFNSKIYPNGHQSILSFTELQTILEFWCLLFSMLGLQPCGRIQQEHVKLFYECSRSKSVTHAGLDVTNNLTLYSAIMI